MMSTVERCHQGMRLNSLALAMKLVGIQTSQEHRVAHKERLNAACDAALKRFRDAIGDPSFNLPDGDPDEWDSVALDNPKLINSAQGLKKLYFGRFKVKPTVFSKESGQPSLDENALKAILANPGVLETVKEATRALLVYRENHKTLSTYVARLDPESRSRPTKAKPPGEPNSYLFGTSLILHPTWNVLQAKTGRWSCSDPNLQNIQKSETTDGVERPGMRDMFKVRHPDNWLVEADYKQLEVRIIAALAKCDKLIAVFNRGEDIYRAIASGIFRIPPAAITKEQRAMAKIFVLASNYGGGIPVIHAQMVLNFPQITPKACEEIQRRFYEEYPEIPAFQKRQFKFAQEHGYVVCPISGRRLDFWLGRVKPTEAANFPIQGTAGDIINPASLKLSDMLNWVDEWILMQIHDALYTETRHVVSMVKRMKDCMEGMVLLGDREVMFEVDVKVGKNWGQMKDWVPICDLKHKDKLYHSHTEQGAILCEGFK